MTNTKQITTALMAFAALGLTAGVANAQDINGDPYAGTHYLDTGFTPDPYRINVTAGGETDASYTLGGACRGMISSRPDVRLWYQAGNTFPLIFATWSQRDTTLVVNAPDGNFYCDDDGGEGLNAYIRFGRPMSGRYEIWVGTYSGGYGDSQLMITELD